MTPKTHTVESAYTGLDNIHRVYVKGHALPLMTDEPLNEGDAVVIRATAPPAISTRRISEPWRRCDPTTAHRFRAIFGVRRSATSRRPSV